MVDLIGSWGTRETLNTCEICGEGGRSTVKKEICDNEKDNEIYVNQRG